VDLAACDDKHKPYKTNSLTPAPSPKERKEPHPQPLSKREGSD